MMEDSITEGQPRKEEEKYKKIRILGEGSMGRAYLVESNEDHQMYVMKRINIGHLSHQEKENAMREAKLHSIVSHHNIIQFKEIYHTTGDKLCIVMEYAENGDLDELIQSLEGKPMPEDEVLKLFAQICLGLRAIHQKKIIHRDLKGANIFLNKDGQVKIGDFGISRAMDQTVLASKSFVGTPYYLCPEMVEGKPYTTKADIWSLGVILYNLCARKLPFDAQSLPVLALKILKGSFPPLTGNYSKQIKSLILNLLQVNPNKRPTISEIIMKPLISKYVPKAEITEIQASIQPKSKENIAKTNRIQKKPSSSKIPTLQTKPKAKKPKASKEDEKLMKEQRTQQAKQKRETLRKEMREDLVKKVHGGLVQRKDNFKPEEQQGQVVITECPSELKSEEKKEISYDSVLTKPWKTKKSSLKKELDIEIYVPVKKEKEEREEPIIPPENDFEVQIYVTGENPYQKQTTEAHNRSETEQEHRKSQQQEEQESIPEQEIIELEDILDCVQGANRAVENLGNDYNDICLYEESENFDTIELTPAKQSNKIMAEQGDEEAMMYITRSENLQEIRQLLEEGIGEEDFIRAYNILTQHLNESQQKKMRGQELEEYTFNRNVLSEKLSFLAPEVFNKYIVLMYTLIMIEDEEMKQNFDLDDNND